MILHGLENLHFHQHESFILLKLKTGLKNLKHSSHTIALSKGLVLTKKNIFTKMFFARKIKNADINKIKRAPW